MFLDLIFSAAKVVPDWCQKGIITSIERFQEVLLRDCEKAVCERRFRYELHPMCRRKAAVQDPEQRDLIVCGGDSSCYVDGLNHSSALRTLASQAV